MYSKQEVVEVYPKPTHLIPLIVADDAFVVLVIIVVSALLTNPHADNALIPEVLAPNAKGSSRSQ